MSEAAMRLFVLVAVGMALITGWMFGSAFGFQAVDDLLDDVEPATAMYFVPGDGTDTGPSVDVPLELYIDSGGSSYFEDRFIVSAGVKVAEVWCDEECESIDSIRFLVDVQVFTDRAGRTTVRFER